MLFLLAADYARGTGSDPDSCAPEVTADKESAEGLRDERSAPNEQEEISARKGDWNLGSSNNAGELPSTNRAEDW